MKRIESIEQLKAEKRRLRLRALTLENNMKSDWANVKTSMAPVNMVLNTFNSSITGVKPNLLNESMNIGIDVILRKVLLRNRGVILKLLVPYLVKNFTGNYIKDHRVDVISWVRNKFSTLFSSNGHDKYYDKSTADVDTKSW